MRGSRIVALWLAGALGSLGCGTEESGLQGIDPVGGGQERVLDYDTFVSSVAPVLEAEGCAAMGDCHGGGIRGAFALSPAGARDLRFDFDQASEQVDDLDPAASALLRKPLSPQAGGAPHGVTAFDSTDDPGYRAILEWIEAGELVP